MPMNLLTRLAAALALPAIFMASFSAPAHGQAPLKTSISVPLDPRPAIAIGTLAREAEKRTGDRYRI